MKRRDMLLTTGPLLAGASAIPFRWVAAAEPKPRKILYSTRNVGYYHSVVRRKGGELSHSERMLTDFGRRVGIDVTCSKDGRVFDGDLDQYDAFVFYCNGDLTQSTKKAEPPMSENGKQRFLDAVSAGKGFIGLHSTCACWRTPGEKDVNSKEIDPFIAMLGGEFIGHGAQQKATMRIASPDFPGLKDRGDSFAMHDEWYALKNFAKDLHVVLVHDTVGMKGGWYQRPPYPSTWARMHGKGRVFFSAIGHREDVWENDTFQQILLGSLAWTLKNTDVDVTPNIEQVTPDAWKLKA